MPPSGFPYFRYRSIRRSRLLTNAFGGTPILKPDFLIFYLIIFYNNLFFIDLLCFRFCLLATISVFGEFLEFFMKKNFISAVCVALFSVAGLFATQISANDKSDGWASFAGTKHPICIIKTIIAT